MGVRNPYQGVTAARRPEPLRMTVIPLSPQGRVPGAVSVSELYAHSPAAEFRTAAEGINLPPEQHTAHFSESQVYAALTTAKDYLVESSLDPDVLTGKAVRPVRILLDPQQLDQFDRSFDRPAADGRHQATGWLVRFDPKQAELADNGIRVQGTLRATESDADTLEVVSDHTFVYALRPAGAGAEAKASLFTVRRELHFRFDRDDLRMHQAEVLVSYVQAGPLSCSVDSTAQLRRCSRGRHRRRAARPAPTRSPRAAPPRCAVLSRRAPSLRSEPRGTYAPSSGVPWLPVFAPPLPPPNLPRSLPPRSPAPPAMSVTSFISGSLELRTLSA